VAQKYPKPPIIEAVLHLRYGTPFDDGALKRIPRLLRVEYPKAKEEADFKLDVELKLIPTKSPPATVVDKGARLLSENDQRVVVVRSSSVVFGHYAPYCGWDEFVEAAHLIFDTLRDKLGYRPVSSVGLRYINRLDVPLPPGGGDLQPSDYLQVGTALPDVDIFQSMNGFQALAEMALSHDRLVARVQAAAAVPALIDHGSLLLDIDVIAQHDIPPKPDEFWALVGRMRDDKNKIFEKCVTDRARELFGWKP
jgi:uncharacterized protein (TIGR04255 family)